MSLYIIRKNLKADERFNTKESFQCYYIPVIIFDSVYRKDGNYYPKVYLEEFIHNIFGGFGSFFWNITKFCFLKYKYFFPGFRLLKYKKRFLLRQYKKFPNIRAIMFHFPKIWKLLLHVIFFFFLSLGLKIALGSYYCKTFHCWYLTVFWICLGSEYASSSTYVRALNMLFQKYKKVLFPKNS